VNQVIENDNAFPKDYTTTHGGEYDEQMFVDMMVRQFGDMISMIYNEDGTVKEELLNKYTVTFTLADGTVTTYADKVKGAEVAVPAAPAEIDGCAFLGWTQAGADTMLDKAATTYTVEGNAAFTAKYADAPDSYIVTFVVDGETVKTESVPYGGNATAPEQAQYVNNGENHKVFSGWTGNYTNVTADATITATYELAAHNWVDGDVTKTPTCNETGLQAQSCVCGATNEKTLEKDPANHADYGTYLENDKAATCKEDGYTGDSICNGCGETLTTGTAIDKATVAHTPGEAAHENEGAHNLLQRRQL
jgi:hypothetical protein